MKTKQDERKVVMDVPKVQSKPLAQNRKASHDYTIEDTVEAGIVLQGTEIKSIRRGSANLKDSYARVFNGEMYVYNMHIAPYEEGNRFNHDPLRNRKLLLKEKKSINSLVLQEKRVCINPT